MYCKFPVTNASFVFIRHWETRKVPGIKEMGVPGSVAFSARHARLLDQDQQGLTVEGTQHAYKHGQAFAQHGVVIQRFLCGWDQRNIEGAMAKQEGYQSGKGSGATTVMRHPLVTYPVYEPVLLAKADAKFGEPALHRWLGGLPELNGLVSETAQGFIARARLLIEDGLLLAQQVEGAVVVDGNFELTVVLHYLFGVEIADWSELATATELFLPSHGHCFGFRRSETGEIEVCRYNLNLEPTDP